jgi:hypothetical protein
MFISKAEKSNLYKLIADLEIRLARAETELKAKPKQPSLIGDEAFAAYKKEYAQKYYWRKKAERLANGSTEGIRTKKKAEPVVMTVEPMIILGNQTQDTPK